MLPQSLLLADADLPIQRSILQRQRPRHLLARDREPPVSRVIAKQFVLGRAVEAGERSHELFFAIYDLVGVDGVLGIILGIRLEVIDNLLVMAR